MLTQWLFFLFSYDCDFLLTCLQRSITYVRGSEVSCVGYSISGLSQGSNILVHYGKENRIFICNFSEKAIGYRLIIHLLPFSKIWLVNYNCWPKRIRQHLHFKTTRTACGANITRFEYTVIKTVFLFNKPLALKREMLWNINENNCFSSFLCLQANSLRN